LPKSATERSERTALARSQDFRLAELHSQARILRIADGSDEVHKKLPARSELAKYS
jgi:alkylation response protein AidB-like acyl-CoA dehydrogenase